MAAVVLASLLLIDNPSFLGFAVNSDSLQLASMTWDLAQHDYAWRGFQLSRVPSLFPDLIVYGAVQMATASWRIAALVYGGLSLLGITAAAGWIIDAVSDCGWRRGCRAFLVLTLPILILELPVTSASHHLDLFIPNNHGGPFILALASLCLTWACLKKPGIGRSLLLFALITAGVLSDLLFVIAVNGPVIVALGYFLLRRAITGRAATLVLAPTVAGVVAAQLLDLLLLERQGMIGIDWTALPTHAWALLLSPMDLATAGPLPVILGYGLPLLGFIWFLLFSRAPAREHGATGAGAFWRLVSLTGVLGTIAAAALVYGDVTQYRYMSPLLWWPIIATATALVRPADYARRYLLPIGLGAEALALAGIYVSQGLHSPAILAWHHPMESCLLEAQRTAGLKAGLAEYWSARSIEASSDWRLQIDEIGRDGAGWYWGNDRFWFTHDIHDDARQPDYNYIVVAQLDPQPIRARYGAPSRVLDCPAGKVWIYDDAAALRRALVRGSPDLYATFLEGSREPREICVPADRFYSAAHPRRDSALEVFEGGLQVRAEEPDSRQPRIWGPFFSLPAGRWNLSLSYRLTSEPPGPNRWEITGEYGWRPLMDGILAPTDGELRTLSLELDLAAPERGIQLRAFLAGTGVIEVKGVRITPAGNDEVGSCGW